MLKKAAAKHLTTCWRYTLIEENLLAHSNGRPLHVPSVPVHYPSIVENSENWGTNYYIGWFNEQSRETLMFFFFFLTTSLQVSKFSVLCFWFYRIALPQLSPRSKNIRQDRSIGKWRCFSFTSNCAFRMYRRQAEQFKKENYLCILRHFR